MPIVDACQLAVLSGDVYVICVFVNLHGLLGLEMCAVSLDCSWSAPSRDAHLDIQPCFPV